MEAGDSIHTLGSIKAAVEADFQEKHNKQWNFLAPELVKEVPDGCFLLLISVFSKPCSRILSHQPHKSYK